LTVKGEMRKRDAAEKKILSEHKGYGQVTGHLNRPAKKKYLERLKIIFDQPERTRGRIEAESTLWEIINTTRGKKERKATKVSSA